MKTLEQFKNIHQGEPIVVCGLGASLNNIPIKDLQQCNTIGVNKIESRFTPDYLFYCDNLNNVLKKKSSRPDIDAYEYIVGSKAKAIFLHELKSNLPHFKDRDRLVHAKAHCFKDYKTYDPNKIYHSLTVTFIAITLAIYMGSKRIGVIGLDYTQDTYFNGTVNFNTNMLNDVTGIENDLAKLMEIKPKGVDIFNLSNQSAFTSLPLLSHRSIELFYRNRGS